MLRRGDRNFKPVELEEDTILYKMHNAASRKGRTVISLRASEVVDFSSQYGSNDSLSYTAQNIVGPPTVYPQTGDNAYSFQLRTYGEWWEMLPSHLKSSAILPCTTLVESQDFIEFHVERRVVPLLLRVYEVYNPGAIVKVLCYCYDTEKWVVMWKGEPQVLPPEESHCFSVEVEGIDFMTDFYRLEFHHKHLDYFCEIDGLILYGECRFCNYFPGYNLPKSSKKESIQKCLTNSGQKTVFTDETSQNSTCLDVLPSEVTSFIFSFLDLQSLCSASKTSKIFQKICYDPALYRDLNLQLYWYLVDVNALKSLQPRLSLLRKLNISWCGGQGRITTSYFIEFLEVNCQNLTSLRLANCSFVNDDCLKAVANYCPHLKELDMRCCHAKDLTQSGFKYISQMSKLIYLDLYRTKIDDKSLNAIVKSLKLEHLLFGGCTDLRSINDIVIAVGKYLKSSLRTLDVWRATELRCAAVYAIAECSNLVELDMGWCYQIDASCGCIKHLIARCPKLKKLFLTAIRTVSNNELNAVAMHCPDMEQLDILGTSEYNLAGLKTLLQNCKKMKLLDVSYAAAEVKLNVSNLRTMFPAVSIKCSLPRNVDDGF
ncbi:F-box/LRR-repeat protein 4 [Araneus ventricosus]|uniref:F-box/LRR-repeat protein 4 n=1 Tax=Araneus ventricosus TaxID=182803 RepID=A0A4Y2E938_ARAVE|nr:F-box/LRR-repeat protein 4 [Araneus ventricosus]